MTAECKTPGCRGVVYCMSGLYARMCGDCKCRALAVQDLLAQPRFDEFGTRTEWMIAHALGKLTARGEIECVPLASGALGFRSAMLDGPAPPGA